MTREEAIEILWRYDVDFEPHPPEEVMHAIDMAIEALKEQPTIPMFTESAEAYKDWTGEEMGADIKAKQKKVGAVVDGIVGHETIQKSAEKAKENINRPHWEWIDYDGKPMKKYAQYSGHCSVCGEWSEYLTDYCGNCGAKMGGDSE